MKAAASINVSDFSVPLKEPHFNPELSYSDLVPNNQRVLLRFFSAPKSLKKRRTTPCFPAFPRVTALL